MPTSSEHTTTQSAGPTSPIDPEYDRAFLRERILELVGSNELESYNVLPHAVQRALCGLRIINERIAGALNDRSDEYELLQTVIAQLECGLELHEGASK